MALLCFLPGNSPASFAAEITTPYLGSYSSITTFTPELLIESIKEPVLPYSGKGYITIDGNLITSRELLEIQLRLASVFSKSDWSLIDQLMFEKAMRVGKTARPDKSGNSYCSTGHNGTFIHLKLLTSKGLNEMLRISVLCNEADIEGLTLP